jgi:hypothetical protein
VLDLEALITNRCHLDEWELAFENLRPRQDVKALRYPNGSDWEEQHTLDWEGSGRTS